MVNLRYSQKSLVKLAIVFLSFVLMGFGEIPPSDIKIKDNKANEPYRLTLPGSKPSKNSRSSQINPNANFQKALLSLPPRFNCDLNGDNETNEFKCSVCNCYHEARGESDQGQINVQKVVYTRELIPGYPNTICGVIRDPEQFSWLNEGARQPYKRLSNGMPEVQKCVKNIVASAKYRNTWFASHYHTIDTRPYWKKNCRESEVHGNHRFYVGGCDNHFPPPNPQRPQSEDAVAWLDLLLYAIPKAIATESSYIKFMQDHPNYKLKAKFSKSVEKLLGPKTNPALVQGDFNGDGIEDTIALLIHNQKHSMVFFISEGRSFKMLSQDIPESESMYLTTIPKKDVLTGLPNNRPRDLVQLEVYLGPTTAYFVENNKVIEFNGTLN